MKRRSRVAAIVCVLLFVIYGVPMFWVLLTSIKPIADVSRGGWTLLFFKPTLGAYTGIVNGALLQAARQSAVIALGTTALVLLVTVPFSYAIARVRGRWPAVVLGVLIILQMMPQTATVLPLFQIFSTWGWLDQTYAVILADAALLTPFAIMLLRPFFRSVPVAIEEAASVDGAGRWRIFRSIALPMARNGLATTGTLVFLLTWGEFIYSINFFTTPENYPLSALLTQQITQYTVNWPGLMALAVLTSLPILAVFAFTYRFLKDGLAVGAVK
jgi:multiple sugar transport system permease protein